MTLTEFLLARITEREAAWRADLHHSASDFTRRSVALGLAECAAMRRIVEDRSFRESQHPARLSIFGERILGLLALPYADHPDYRQEWKP